MEFRTCTYIRDDGNICNSAAVTDRNLCLYHLEHRARLMRMAQYRARRVVKDAAASNGGLRPSKPSASIVIARGDKARLVTKVQVPVLS
jgi:hypothetical protein